MSDPNEPDHRAIMREFLENLECPDAKEEVLEIIRISGVESTILFLREMGEDI